MQLPSLPLTPSVASAFQTSFKRAESLFNSPIQGVLSCFRPALKLSRAVALAAVGVMLALGNYAALAQTTIPGDTQYLYQNSTGAFSTGFTPVFTTDNNGQLNFGGTAAYTVTDDLAAANVNNLTFSNTALVTLAQPTGVTTNTLTLTPNSLGIGPSIFVGSGGATIQTVLAGTAGFTKTGSGTMILNTNADTYTGNVFVTAGQLQLNIGQAAGANYFVSPGASLTTNQALAVTNTFTALSGITTFVAGVTNVSLAGNGNVNFTLGNTTGFNAGFFNAFGGVATSGNNNSFRILQSTSGGTLLSPFAGLDFAATSGNLTTRNGTATIVLGSLASTSATAGLFSGSNAGSTTQTTYVIGSANSSTTFAGVINNGTSVVSGVTSTANNNLTKVGTGTFTLTGLSNYTGTTAVNGGTLRLDYSVNPTGILNAGTTLGFGGGTLSLLGKNTGATTQTLGNVNVNAGGGRVVLNANGGTSTALTLGTLTATTSGGSLNFNVGANTSVTTTSAVPATGIYSGRITYTDSTGATNFATSASTAAPFTLSGYNAYIPIATAGGTDTNNSIVTDSATLAGALTTNTLKAANTSAGQSLNLGGNALTLTGGGLLFTGANDYAINNGTLASVTSAATPDVIINQFGVGNLTIGAVISNGTATGAGTLTKSGPGTLTLTGSNIYTGATFLNNGITSISANANLGAEATGATLNLNTGTLRATGTFGLFNGAAGTNNRNVVLYGGGGTIDVTAGSNLTVAGVISNVNTSNLGPLTKTGAGTLTLSGANTYSGATIISGGTLSINSIANGGVFLGNNTGSTVAASTTVTVSSTAGLSVGQSVIGGNIPANDTIASVDTPTTFSLAVAGSGTSQSTVDVFTPNGLGSSPNTANALIIDGATLQYTGPAASTDRTFTITQNGATLDASGTGALTFSSFLPIVYSGSGARTLTLAGTGAGNNTFGLPINDGTGGSTSLTKSGSNTWVLTNPSHTYTGNTTILSTGGTLALSAPLSTNPIPTSPVISVGQAAASTARLDVTGLNGGTLSLAGGQTLAGTGVVVGGVVVNTASILSPGSSTVPVATLSITGALTLNNGSVSNFDLTSTASFDTIAVAGALSLNSTAGINLFQAGTINKYTTPGTYNLFTFGTLTGTPSTALSILNPATGLTYAFGSTGNRVTLTISGSAAITSVWNLNGNGNYGTAGNWNNNTVPDAVGATATFGPIITQARTVNIEANHTVGEIDFNNANAYTLAAGGGTLALNNGSSAAVIQDFSGNHAINAPVTLSAGLNTTVATAGNVLTIAGNIGGTGPLTKLGAGTLALTGTNTYSAGTTISNGTVQINSASSLGAVAGTTKLDSSVNGVALEALNSIVTPRNFTLSGVNNTIQVDGATSAYEIDGVVADGTNPGTLTTAGTGTLVLGGTNTFMGITTIGAGSTLQLGGTGANTANGSVVGNIVDNGTLAINRSDDYALNNLVSGTGSLNKLGTNTLSLTGANTFSGTTTITNGVITLTNPLALQNSTLAYNNPGGTLDLNTQTAVTLGGLSGNKDFALTNNAATPAAVALTIGANNTNTNYSGALGGLGSLIKVGTGISTLSGANNLAGTTTVNLGNLTLTGALGSTAAPAAGVTVNTAGVFTVNGGTLTGTSLTENNNGSLISLTGNGIITLSGTLAAGANNGSSGGLISLLSGTLTANSVTIGRTALNNTAVPAAGSATDGLYVNGGTLNVATTLGIGTSTNTNSSANLRMDSGAIIVGGTTTVAINNGGRYSTLDINGGTFTSNDTTGGGIVLGGPSAGSNGVLLVRAGTLTTNTITFGNPTQLTGTGTLNITGGTTYIGAGGLVAVPGYTPTINFNGGTLGATADWQSLISLNLGGTGSSTIQTADAAGVPHTITLGNVDSSGVNIPGGLSGTGNLVVGGGGTLVIGATSGYTGTTTINAGTVSVVSSSTQAGSLSGTTAITINPNGNLAFNGVAATTDRVNDNATITLNGGRISTNGLSEGGFSSFGLGTLTLNASSIIDLGVGNSTLAFKDSSLATWVGRLSVFNWSGSTAGNGVDQIFVGMDANGLTSSQLAMIQFYSGNNTGAIGSGAMILSTGEIVPAPVPEPATSVMILALGVGALGWGQRRRLSGLTQVLQRRLAA